jgi:hypothetical protein
MQDLRGGGADAVMQRVPQGGAIEPDTAAQRRTVRNSCPTAPVTPTTAMRGPLGSLAACTDTTRALLPRMPALTRICR